MFRENLVISFSKGSYFTDGLEKKKTKLNGLINFKFLKGRLYLGFHDI